MDAFQSLQTYDTVAFSPMSKPKMAEAQNTKQNQLGEHHQLRKTDQIFRNTQDMRIRGIILDQILAPRSAKSSTTHA